jgi:hypothetical protein
MNINDLTKEWEDEKEFDTSLRTLWNLSTQYRKLLKFYLKTREQERDERANIAATNFIKNKCYERKQEILKKHKTQRTELETLDWILGDYEPKGVEL